MGCAFCTAKCGHVSVDVQTLGRERPPDCPHLLLPSKETSGWRPQRQSKRKKQIVFQTPRTIDQLSQGLEAHVQTLLIPNPRSQNLNLESSIDAFKKHLRCFRKTQPRSTLQNFLMHHVSVNAVSHAIKHHRTFGAIRHRVITEE